VGDPGPRLAHAGDEEILEVGCRRQTLVQGAEEPFELDLDDGLEHGILATREEPIDGGPAPTGLTATSSSVVFATPQRAMQRRAASTTRSC